MNLNSVKPIFGHQQFNEEEKEKIRNLLQQKLGIHDNVSRLGSRGCV